MRWVKRLLILFVLLVLVGSGAYWVLLVHIPDADEAGAEISLADARTYAAGTGGDGPVRINVERIIDATFPKIAVSAGGSWDDHTIAIYSFQLVYADGTSVVIDTAVTEEQAQEMPGLSPFNQDGFDRMLAAMSKARKIVLTHEHMDHIGGLVVHDDLEALLDATDLTEDQLAEPERMAPAEFPEGALDDYVPISYTDYYQLLPGISLIKAPGHSPGSQMIFVRLASGEEFLFVGDIAWDMSAIDAVRGRPRLISQFMLKEDRAVIQAQLQTLNLLSRQEPGLNFVVAHDAGQIEGYINTGLMNQGFE